MIEKIVYAATNPVKDRLVERVHQWPGASSFAAFPFGRPMTVTRPLHFFRNPGAMPKTATLRIVIPPELGPAEDVIREVCAWIEALEASVAAERKRTGAGVFGRRNILAQSWKDSPTTVEPRRGRNPRFAGCVEHRVEALASYRAFSTHTN